MWMEIHPTTCTALQRIMGCNCQIPEVPSTTTISFSHCYLWRTFHITCRDRGLSKFQNVGALSDDPFNPTYLSPGHVIIGEPLTQLPAAEYTNVKCKRLSSWQTYQQQIKKFWQRWWSYEFQSLQQRKRWQMSSNLQKGDLVLLREVKLTTLQWPTGIIRDTHAGKDGIVRVITLRTPKGT
jgi:hypothetical protein